MRDRDDLEEQRWQPASSGPSRHDDPLAELARLVGQGAPPVRPAAPPAAPAGVSPNQQDWINEIERAFAQVVPQAPAPQQAQPAAGVQRQAGDNGNPEVPAWLRSPAVPVIPVPEGGSDPRTNPDVFAQEFTRALDEVAEAGTRTGYHAQDPYQLAAGGTDGFGAAAADASAGAQAFSPHADNWPQAAGLQARNPASNPVEEPAQGAAGYGVYGDLDDEYRPADQSPDALADGDEDDYAYAGEPPARRRKIVAAALALGVGALAVTGVLMFRGGESVDGEPPVVSADSQPVKVEPESPGGVEVPNTNRAIYEHTNEAPTGEGAVVVDDREQPVDINQMIAQQNAAAEQRAAEARAAQEQAARTATTVTSETTTAPPVGAADVALPDAPQPTSPAIAELGEPRRVRTVSVRPDGSILPSSPAAPEAAQPGVPTIEQLASATPSATVTTPTVTSPTAPETQAPAVAPPVGPVPRPASVNRPATRAPLQLGPTNISPQAAGSQVAAVQAPAPAAAASQPGAAGAFTVQLAAPGSESEARNLFASLQRRHGELSGYSPIVVRAETGGRTIYRLRVGSFQSRDQATALCVRIQATGGQCFVARN